MKVRLPDGSFVEVGNDSLFNDDDTPLTFPTTAQAVTGRTFSEDDVARIRQEEKDKLYGTINDLRNEITGFREQVGGLTAAEQRRQEQAQQELERAEAERRSQEEEELSARELIERRDREWQERLDQMNNDWSSKFETSEQERQNEAALRAKERQFNDLREHIQNQVAANQDKIAPELLPWITGNSVEEVDAAVAKAVETTNQILAGLQQSGQVPPPQETLIPVGVRPVGGPSSVDPGQQFQTLTAEQIAQMPMDQYAQLRSKIGVAPQGQNRGLFG